MKKDDECLNLVTIKDKEILLALSDVELADMSKMLNSWLWPELLPDDEGDNYVFNGRRSQLMKYIETKVGAEFISRRWNIDRMTDKEHKKFWHSKRNITKGVI